MSVLLLTELTNFFKSSFLFFLARLLNSALAFFNRMRRCSQLVFLNILSNRFLLSLSFCNCLLHQGLGKCFFIPVLTDFEEIWSFYKNLRLEFQQIVIDLGL